MVNAHPTKELENSSSRIDMQTTPGVPCIDCTHSLHLITLPFDLEGQWMPWACHALPTLVLIDLAVLLLERGHTHTYTHSHKQGRPQAKFLWSELAQPLF